MKSQLYSTSEAHKKNAKITGIFYILATVISISAVLLCSPLTFKNDNPIISQAIIFQISLGIFADLLTVCSVAGTAIMLYPYIRRYKESLGVAYLGFRWFEALTILAGVLPILIFISMEEFRSVNFQPERIQFGRSIVKTIHDCTMIIGPNFLLGINTFIYSSVFFKTKLVPKWLAVFGMSAAILIFIASILEIFNLIEQVSVTGGLFAFPVFLYEMVLAYRLITKGFNLNSPLIKEYNLSNE